MSDTAKKEVATVETTDVVESEMKVTLTKTYLFEDQQIGEIDMSGLENMTANDMIKANRVLNSSGNFSVVPELTLEYSIVIAASATGLPVEFFKTLVPRDAMRVKNKVTDFFFGKE